MHIPLTEHTPRADRGFATAQTAEHRVAER
jgi:hypothetical protein